ncbi:MAG: hypothetical protein O2968_02460 [Acidobacteria bacterium]|nr:hypothetical protein [Acidobacteriota bacterium]
MTDWKRNSLTIVVLLWAGILFGVSFLATPAKFQAPSLTLPAAVDVGRSTFAALNRVELGCALLAGALLLGGAARGLWLRFASGLAILGVLLETVWLLPVLDERARIVIDGGMPPASNLHELYIALDVVKFLALVTAAFLLLSRTEPALHH